MKKIFYYLSLILVFIVGIFSGSVYTFAGEFNTATVSGTDFKSQVFNSFYYFLSLIVTLWLLTYSSRRQKDFLLFGAMYGIASLIYDVTSVQIVGGILFLTVLLKIYFKLFPEDKFWQKR